MDSPHSLKSSKTTVFGSNPARQRTKSNSYDIYNLPEISAKQDTEVSFYAGENDKNEKELSYRI